MACKNLPAGLTILILVCFQMQISCRLTHAELSLKSWLKNLTAKLHINTGFLCSNRPSYTDLTAVTLSGKFIPLSSSSMGFIPSRFQNSNYQTRFIILSAHIGSVEQTDIDGNPASDLYIFITSRRFVPSISSLKIRFFLTFCTDEFNPPNFPNWLTSISNPPMNLAAAHIRFCTVKVTPFTIASPTTGLVYDGMWPRMLEHLQKTFNFTYDLNADTKGGTGALLPNGSWTGMMGEIVSGRSEAGAATAIGLHRFHAPIGFTGVLFTASGTCIMALPHGKIPWDTMMKPFSPVVWVYLAASLALVATVSYLISSFRTFNKLSYNLILPQDIIALLFRLLLDQWAQIPSELCLLTTSWLLFLTVINSTYKKGLFSAITFPEKQLLPQDIESLSEHEDYRLLFQYWQSHMYYEWKNSDNSSLMHHLFDRLERQKDFTNCVMTAITTPRTVCIGYSTDIAAIIAKNLTVVPNFMPGALCKSGVYPSSAVLPFRKGSLYLESFKRIVSWYSNGNVINGFYNEVMTMLRNQSRPWIVEAVKGDGSLREMLLPTFIRDVPLTVDNCLALFYLYSGLVIVSVAVFAIEFASVFRKETHVDDGSNPKVESSRTKSNSCVSIRAPEMIPEALNSSGQNLMLKL